MGEAIPGRSDSRRQNAGQRDALTGFSIEQDLPGTDRADSRPIEHSQSSCRQALADGVLIQPQHSAHLREILSERIYAAGQHLAITIGQLLIGLEATVCGLILGQRVKHRFEIGVRLHARPAGAAIRRCDTSLRNWPGSPTNRYGYSDLLRPRSS